MQCALALLCIFCCKGGVSTMQTAIKVSFAHRIKDLGRRIWKMRIYYLLLIPFLTFIFVFKYKPMYGVTLAFKDFKIIRGISGSPWAGFKYFEQLFRSFSFFEVLRNTLIISLGKLLFSFPAPIILALFINELRAPRLKKVFQTCSYLPHFISWIIAASIIKDVFALGGPINAVRQLFGAEPVYYMASTTAFRPILYLTAVWKNCGWNSIIYLAAISGIDPCLYEAATIDGANKRQTIQHITLPCISITIITLFILDIGKIMFAGFDQVYNLYSPAVYSVGDILDTYTYRQGLLNKNYSYSTAAGLFQNVIGFALVVISNFFVSRISDGEASIW